MRRHSQRRKPLILSKLTGSTCKLMCTFLTFHARGHMSGDKTNPLSLEQQNKPEPNQPERRNETNEPVNSSTEPFPAVSHRPEAICG
jgi:hypothetical protein